MTLTQQYNATPQLTRNPAYSLRARVASTANRPPAISKPIIFIYFSGRANCWKIENLDSSSNAVSTAGMIACPSAAPAVSPSRTMLAVSGEELEPAKLHGLPVEEERPVKSPGDQDCNPRPELATFEQRFEQFYLQLSEGKTGGMVVSEHCWLLLHQLFFFSWVHWG